MCYTEMAWKGLSGERWNVFSPVVSDSRGSSLSMVPGPSQELLPASCHLSTASLRSTPVHSPLSQILCTLPSHREILGLERGCNYPSIPASPRESGLWWELDVYGPDPKSGRGSYFPESSGGAVQLNS